MACLGVWMTESEQLLYRAVPKAACFSIGQILFFSEHGVFYDGDIHNASTVFINGRWRITNFGSVGQ